jgi:uncharacterized phiE125 gp8 family phage protein
MANPIQHLQLDTGPATEPVTTQEYKDHLRVDITTDDTLIDGLGTAAREWAEMYTRRAFVTQTWDVILDEFPGTQNERFQEHRGDIILIPKAPLQSITSITYVDENGDSQTFSSGDYIVDTASEPGRVFPIINEVWPTIQSVGQAVTVKFVAGYGAASAVPEGIKLALKMIVGAWYNNREDYCIGGKFQTVPFGARSLLDGFRLWSSR